MNMSLLRLLVAALVGVGALTTVFAQTAATGTPGAALPPNKETSGPALTTAEGTVTKLDIPKNPSGVVSFTLTTADKTYLVRMAQDGILKQKGIALTEGAKVSVAGITHEYTVKGEKITSLVTWKITLDGKTTELIVDGKATWSQYDLATVVTLTGTVKDLVVPEDKTTGGDSPVKHFRQYISFTLVTEKEEQKLALNAQKAKELGVTLTNGQKITVSGWQFPGPTNTTTLRDVTIDGKTYTFIDAGGNHKPGK